MAKAQRSNAVASALTGDGHKKVVSRKVGPRKRPSRSKGLRTRTGCNACRSRRVKCDETRPACGACVKRGDECLYPADSVHGKTSEASLDEVSDVSSSEPGRDSSLVHRPEQIESQTEAQSLPASDTDARLWRSNDGDSGGEKTVEEDRENAMEEEQSNQPTDLQVSAISQPELSLSSANLQSSPTFTRHEILDPHFSPHAWDSFSDLSWTATPPYSAEAASLLWFGLLANDSSGLELNIPSPPAIAADVDTRGSELSGGRLEGEPQNLQVAQLRAARRTSLDRQVTEQDILTGDEVSRFQHFVLHLSKWIDLTDPDQSFAINVPQMALTNRGLMRAILALSARHRSLGYLWMHSETERSNESTLAVQYYNQTLQYLQQAMQDAAYLRSDELLTTVLIVSTYEMIDASGRDWERHLKGVFYIQRSQVIHGESYGIKKCIWWAWLRQDIWAAFKDGRKILSFYTLKKPCAELGYWELLNRAFFLLGQCVNYASDDEVRLGATSIQSRVDRGESLLSSIREWESSFAPYDRRLPTLAAADFPFTPIWINPSTASVAVQVTHFSRLLLMDLMPAPGGMREITARQGYLQESVAAICGIAYCTTESAAIIVSSQCLYAARRHASAGKQVEAIRALLLSNQGQTGWPNRDIDEELSI